MRNFFCLLFCLFLGSRSWADYGLPPPPPQVDARAWVLLDAASGQELAGQNQDLKLAPASLTKLMAAYLVFDAIERGKLNREDVFAVPAHAAAASGARMFASVGQKVRVDDLLAALAVQSANDAVLSLAQGMAGSEAEFVARMNAQAQKLGLANTRFFNVTGHTQDGHVSSARDLATLAYGLITRFPQHYKRYFSRRDFTFNGVTQQNRNRLLWLDPQVDGVKTGHNASAGYCIVASAERNRRRLIAVVMGARSETGRAMHAQQLLNYGFLHTESVRYYRAGETVTELPVYKGSSGGVRLGFLQDFSFTLDKGASGRLKAQIITRQPVIAPVGKGQRLGTLRMTLDGKVLGDYPLVALDEVPVAGWFGRIWDGLRLLGK